jgi:phosphate butyryltransferase
MYANFDDILNKALNLQKYTISICAADDEKMIQVVKEIQRLNLCNCILVGDREKIIDFCKQEEVDSSIIEIIDEKDRVKSCLTAVELVSSGKAQVFVKGNVNTSHFLHAVLDKQVGLRTGRKLNVLSCYEIPGEKKLLFLTDGGMITFPTLNYKIDILYNSIQVLNNMGIERPKVAILAANEQVSPEMPATVDAQALCRLAERNELPPAIYEGPIAFDVAMKPSAAKIKGIESKISGDVDLLLVPNIEVGNCLGKAIGYYGKGTMAGLVVGASKPVIMSSRASSLKGKITSIAWALLSYKD